MLSAQDYLAGKLQEAERAAEVSEFRALFYQRELGKRISKEEMLEVTTNGLTNNWMN